MQAVTISVMRLRQYVAGDQFDVFGDGGTGTIDWTTTLLDRRAALWPESMPSDGHLLDGHVSSRHLDAVDPDGHLDGVHLLDEHLWPAAPLAVETPGYMFGVVRHAVKTYDRYDNSRPDLPQPVSTVVNSSPTAPRDMIKGAYDSGNDRMTFEFEASSQLG
jgi:hypothetical protein